MSCTIALPADQLTDDIGAALVDLLAAPGTGRAPHVHWSPGRMDFPEDEDGECLFCHGSPGPGGCGDCGAPGK